MNNNSSSTRLPIPQYVMTLAHAAALRSEDPYRKVGAAALDADNRVIGTAYNGLYPGFKAQDTFWASREERQKYMAACGNQPVQPVPEGGSQGGGMHYDALYLMHAGAVCPWRKNHLLL